MFAASAFAASAQNSATPAGDELKTQEQILDELKLRRAEVEALTKERDALKGQVSVYEQLVKVERERGDFFKQAAEARAQANDIDARRDDLRKEQLSMYQEENLRLRSENAKLRNPGFFQRIFRPDSLTAFAAGYGARGLQCH